jgi:hypothetical protein
MATNLEIGKIKDSIFEDYKKNNELDHFRRVAKMVDIGSDAQRIN